MTNKKRIFFLGAFLIMVLIFFELYIRHDHPKFFDNIIENSKNDSRLMEQIGGYKSFEYSFNKNDLKKDTLDFEIKLIGNKKNALFVGRALKNPDKRWVVTEKEVVISNQ